MSYFDVAIVDPRADHVKDGAMLPEHQIPESTAGLEPNPGR